LRSVFLKKFKNHWYETTPWRGQAFRSIMYHPTGPLDSVLSEALAQTTLPSIRKYMPQEAFHLWIDPGEVEIRFEDSHRSQILYQQRKPESVQTNDKGLGSVPFSPSKTNPIPGHAPLQMKQAMPSTVQRPSPVNSFHPQPSRRTSPAPRTPDHFDLQKQRTTGRQTPILQPHVNLNYHAPPFMIKAK
jgi:hypothetical protein